jgi:hypothetical protein
MGIYDEIRWDAVLPEGHPLDSRLFQTKSLDYPSLLEWIRRLADGEPWTAVGAAHVKYFQARSKAKIERCEAIPEEQLDEHMPKSITEQGCK